MNDRLDKEEIQLRLLKEYDDLKEEIKILNDLLIKTDTDANDSELNRHLKRIID